MFHSILRLKKGDVQIEPVMAMALGLAILALVGAGIFVQYTGKINFFKLLPDFGVENTSTFESSIIGYRLDQDSLEFYNGVTWKELDDESEFKYSGEHFSSKFVRFSIGQLYWHNLNLRGGGYKFPDSNYKFKGFFTGPVNYGDTLYSFILFSRFDEEFILNWDNKLYRLNTKDDRLGTSYSIEYFSDKLFPEIRIGILEPKENFYLTLATDIAPFGAYYSTLINWRDSILNKPMKLNENYYCVEKIENRLVFDLAKPVNMESVC